MTITSKYSASYNMNDGTIRRVSFSMTDGTHTINWVTYPNKEDKFWVGDKVIYHVSDMEDVIAAFKGDGNYYEGIECPMQLRLNFIDWVKQEIVF